MVYNPRSGRGKGEKLAGAIAEGLSRRGHTLTRLQMLADPKQIEQAIDDADRSVVVGGDGTVHHLLPVLAETRTPLYHCGTGTANLIGTEFAMVSRPARAIEDIERDGEPVLVDMPTCNGHPFLIMVSLGIDASVIHRFEESRKLGGYRSYVLPTAREILSPRPATFTLRDWSHPKPAIAATGILVVANMRSYGGGFNPCPDARSDDGLLDAAIIPCRGSVVAGLRYGVLALRRTPPGVQRVRGDALEIMAEQTQAFVQIDGEKAVQIPGLNGGRLSIGDRLEFRMSGKHICMHARSS